MKHKISGFLSGFLVAILFVTLAVPAFALSQKQATLNYNDIKITLNGTAVTPKDANGNPVEPFIIDGTTYLPVRAVADALGIQVEWDGSTNTVKLSDPGAVASGTVVYDDPYVTIAFAGIGEPRYANLQTSAVIFNVTNKTDYTLTFQANSIALDGISYEVSCSEEVAPNSTGKVRCNSKEQLPSNVSTTSGSITVVDFTRELLKTSYDATWSGK